MKLLNAIEMTDVNGGSDPVAVVTPGAIGLGTILHAPHIIIGSIEFINYIIEGYNEGCPVATADDLLKKHDPYNGDHFRRKLCEFKDYLTTPRG